MLEASALKYLNTDLLCYRAEEGTSMAESQHKGWDPWLAWFEKRFGSKLETTTALSALNQDAALQAVVSNHVKSLKDKEIIVLQNVTVICGSLILALAFVDGEISAEEAFAVATVEESHKAEIYNEEKYGADPHQEKKLQVMKQELVQAESFLRLL